MEARTIFITVAVMVLANGAVLANIQRDLPEALRPSAIRWQIATLLIAIGSGFFAFGTALPVPILVVLANCALVVGLTFYHWAIQQFYGESPSAVDAVISATLVACTYWFSAVYPNFTLRVLLVSLCWIAILGRSLLTLRRYRCEDPSRSRRMMLVIYAVVLVFVIVRASLYLREGFPAVFTVASRDIAINLASPVIMALLPVVGTTAFTLMCVDAMRRQLQVAASTDYLTGLANRRTLDARGQEMVAGSGGRGFAALVFDLDDFKGVNDTYGHAAGDRVLVHAANQLSRLAREGDLVVRSGGEEFVILMKDADRAAALALAERMRASIEEGVVRVGAENIRVTVSAGVAVYRPDDRGFDGVVRRADRALYRAKLGGRNQVQLAE